MTDQALDEINEKVAKKMGYQNVDTTEESDYTGWVSPAGEICDLPDYSRDIKAAMTLVHSQDFMLRFDNKRWRAWFNHKKNDIAELEAPIAICLAFLKDG